MKSRKGQLRPEAPPAAFGAGSGRLQAAESALAMSDVDGFWEFAFSATASDEAAARRLSGSLQRLQDGDDQLPLPEVRDRRRPFGALH